MSTPSIVHSTIEQPKQREQGCIELFDRLGDELR